MGLPDFVITTIDRTVLPPLLLDTAKEHMRVDFSTDDPDILQKIAAAISIYENKTGQIINPTTADWSPVLNSEATSYVSPLQPISAFIATDVDDLVVTSQYETRSASITSPVFMARKDGAVFPAGTAFELTLGYSTEEAIPPDALMSILRIVGKLYEYRESVSVASLDAVPLWMDDLLVGAWVPRC